TGIVSCACLNGKLLSWIILVTPGSGLSRRAMEIRRSRDDAGGSPVPFRPWNQVGSNSRIRATATWCRSVRKALALNQGELRLGQLRLQRFIHRQPTLKYLFEIAGIGVMKLVKHLLLRFLQQLDQVLSLFRGECNHNSLRQIECKWSSYNNHTLHRSHAFARPYWKVP